MQNRKKDNEIRTAVSRILNTEAATENEFRDVTEEIKICQEVAKLSHDNILAFYGTWVEGKNLNLGFEFAARGDLTEFLQTTRQRQTDTRMSTMTNYDVIKILTQIAQGLSFLHQRNIIHGNLRGLWCFLLACRCNESFPV